MEQISVDQSGSETVITFTGTIDTNNSRDMEIIAKAAIAAAQSVVLDFKKVTYMDSTGLGFLVGMKTQADKANIPLILQNLPDHITQLLNLTRLKDTFRIR